MKNLRIRQAILLHSSFVRNSISLSRPVQSPHMSSLLAIYAFALGAVVGSFLNVVIHRYPREESIVFPASHCPNCKTPIRWYDNIPILSYLILAGRCRSCAVPISPRYPLVELPTALLSLATLQRTGPT